MSYLCGQQFVHFVGDGNMSVAFGIYALHFLAEELAVCRSVAEVVDGDEIMDHLMEDGVLDQFFRQVVTGVNT